MASSAVPWIALVAGSLTAGVAIVGVLVVRRSFEPLAVALFLAGAAIAAYSLVTITAAFPASEFVLYAVAFLLAAAGGGYALASSLLLEVGRRTARLDIPDHVVATTSVPAVIVVCTVEPESYSMTETASLLADLSEEDRLDASISSLPLVFFAQKARYVAIGGTSPARGELKRVVERLDSELNLVAKTSVTWASCTGRGRLAARVAQAVAAGHTRVVVAELGVASSPALTAAKREVDALRLAHRGVDLGWAGPFGANDALVAMLSSAAFDAVGEPESTGVVLVGHGQPAEESLRDDELDQVETVLLNRVRLALVERGLPETHVRLAWAEWATPDVTSSVRHLAAVGPSRIVVLPTVFPLDTLATRLDLETAVRQARTSEEVETVILPAWGDDPTLIAELTRLISDTLTADASAR